ncbi:MAG TPA: hypothetical protein VH087_18700 [Thermoanaerobaculia bacterium]|jgi:hypothetical protein|nr:hypothetical protein [Thermoanaerobaculia bacterium]
MSSSAPTPPPPPSPTGAGGDLVYPQQPPKDPIIILVLNLLVAGCVGYFMIGQKTKGIVALVVWILGLASCGIVSGIVGILAGIDGYFQAEQLKAGFPVGQWTFFKDHK